MADSKKQIHLFYMLNDSEVQALKAKYAACIVIGLMKKFGIFFLIFKV